IRNRGNRRPKLPIGLILQLFLGVCQVLSSSLTGFDLLSGRTQRCQFVRGCSPEQSANVPADAEREPEPCLDEHAYNRRRICHSHGNLMKNAPWRFAVQTAPPALLPGMAKMIPIRRLRTSRNAGSAAGTPPSGTFLKTRCCVLSRT